MSNSYQFDSIIFNFMTKMLAFKLNKFGPKFDKRFGPNSPFNSGPKCGGYKIVLLFQVTKN